MDECNDAFSRGDKKLILESVVEFIKKVMIDFDFLK